MTKKNVRIITDGSCIKNPGPGGWAAKLVFGPNHKIIQGSNPHTTNNAMELTAAIEGIKALKEGCHVEIISDSQYVTNPFNKGWIHKWKQYDFKPNGFLMPNHGLWEQMFEFVFNKGHDVVFTWVRGHSVHEGNNEVDVLAKEAARKQL